MDGGMNDQTLCIELRYSQLKKRSFAVLSAIHRLLEMLRVQMDKRAFEKLKRGKMTPEGTLGLQGLTLRQAQPTLIQFIIAASGDLANDWF